jgi:hypothetical protein
VLFVLGRREAASLASLRSFFHRVQKMISEQKFQVTVFGVDQEKVAALNAACSYICRILWEEIAAASSLGVFAVLQKTLSLWPGDEKSLVIV